jgi:hypothetical protein
LNLPPPPRRPSCRPSTPPRSANGHRCGQSFCIKALNGGDGVLVMAASSVVKRGMTPGTELGQQTNRLRYASPLVV